MLRTIVLAFAAAVAFACSWDYPIWIPRSKSADPLYRFVKDSRAGYIDREGSVIVPPERMAFGNSGSAFHDGRLEIAASGGHYINAAGETVRDKNLEYGWDFSEGLAVAMRKGDNRWGYIDTSGEFVIAPRFAMSLNDSVDSFSDGLAKIRVRGKVGFIDRTGNLAIKPEFLRAGRFTDGMAWVISEGPCLYWTDGPCSSPVFVGNSERDTLTPCKFTYVDKAGRVITDDRFDAARDFSEGLAPVRMGTLWGFIDKSGALVIPPQFDDATPFSSSLARVRRNSLYGFVDKLGSLVIEAQFAHAGDFSDGLAPVNDADRRHWYIDRKGERAFPGEFAEASPFFKGLAHVKLLPRNPTDRQARFAYIDVSGRRVFEY